MFIYSTVKDPILPADAVVRRRLALNPGRWGWVYHDVMEEGSKAKSYLSYSAMPWFPMGLLGHTRRHAAIGGHST